MDIGLIDVIGKGNVGYFLLCSCIRNRRVIIAVIVCSGEILVFENNSGGVVDDIDDHGIALESVDIDCFDDGEEFLYLFDHLFVLEIFVDEKASVFQIFFAGIGNFFI